MTLELQLLCESSSPQFPFLIYNYDYCFLNGRHLTKQPANRSIDGISSLIHGRTIHRLLRFIHFFLYFLSFSLDISLRLPRNHHLLLLLLLSLSQEIDRHRC